MDRRRKISLIIPVKDEGNSIMGLLDSIEGQVRKPDGIVITDGGSKDDTLNIIESYIRKGHPIKLIKTDRAYPGKARNLAIEAASHDLIAMTDGGIKLGANWLDELVQPLEKEKEVDVVYGNYEPVTDSFFKECLAIAFVPASKILNGEKTRSHFIASSLMKKKVWESVGGFPDFRAAEDRIFMERIEKKRFVIRFAPRARVLWEIPGDFKTVFKRFSLYSTHDLKAGRFKDWHRSIIAMYLTGAVIIMLGVFFSPLWFLLLALGIFLRVMGLISEKFESTSFFDKLNLKRIFLVTVLVIWIDLAMFYGTARYICLELNRKI